MTLFFMLNPKQADISDNLKSYDGAWKKKKHKVEELPFKPALEIPTQAEESAEFKEKLLQFQKSKYLIEQTEKKIQAFNRENLLVNEAKKRETLELARRKELQRRREIALELLKLEEEQMITIALTMLDD